MAKHRKEGNEYTTISIRWSDKEKLRKRAQFVKKTKNGDLYESDAVVFSKLLKCDPLNEVNISHNTYPEKNVVVDTSLSINQQD